MDNCSRCGRFFSYQHFGTYTPYGSSEDIEPPDERYICSTCLGKLTDQDWAYLRWTWLPIAVYRDGAELLVCSCTGDMHPFYDDNLNIIGEQCWNCNRVYLYEPKGEK